jgi:hypothetical protein
MGKFDLIFIVGTLTFCLLSLGMLGSNGRRRAKEVVCLNNLRQWGVIFRAYTDENNSFFWSGTGPGPDFSINYSRTGQWMHVLRKWYGDNPGLCLCPEATIPISAGMNLGRTHSAWGVASSSSYRYTEGDFGSYGVNQWLQTRYPGGAEAWGTIDISGGDNIPMFSGSYWSCVSPKHTDRPPAEEDVINHCSAQDMERVCVNRHQGHVNQVFMDLSARKIGLKSLWRLKWHRYYDLYYPLPDWPDWMADFPEPPYIEPPSR